ncbi:hypothetical protein [Lacrimispora brassicae]
MEIPEYLLECLQIKKIEMGTEVKSFQDDMKAYLIIYPIEEKKVQKYKTNLLPIVTYEIRYIRHKDTYTDEDWGDDYDYVLADTTTRIKRSFVQRTENDMELVKHLSDFTLDFNQFKRLLPFGSFNSALVNNPINCYLEDTQMFPHLWIEDYTTK